MNLRSLDLNLLLVLDALLESGGVGGAAERLGLSQPAVSNALRRLRERLGRPLFTRHGRQLVPTPETLALAPVVRSALATLDQALFSLPGFQPQLARGTVTLGMTDYWYARLLPPLVAHLEQQAPGVQLQTSGTGEEVLADALPRGDVDAAIFLHPRTHPGVRAEILLSDSYVLVARRGHPLAQRAMSLEDFAEQRQVLVSPQGPWASQLGAAMRRKGLAFRVALRTAQMQVAMDVVARTDYVSVLPRRVAEQMRRGLPVRLLPLPVPTDGFTLALYWHERSQDDPLHRWFRTLTARLARQVYRRR
jgi:DNA-binding transcriptional LysR family regulator